MGRGGCEPASSEAGSRLEAAHAWLAARGARVGGVALRVGQGACGCGAGVYATTAAKEGTVVASFPLGLARAGEALVPEGHECDVSSGVVLAAWLAAHRRLGSASPFAPWLAALPAEGGALACWEARAADAALHGTPLGRAALMQRGALDAELTSARPLFEALLDSAGAGADTPRCELAHDEYLHARCMVWSRSVGLPAGEGGEVEAVLPGMDFCNHADAEANARWELLLGGSSEEAELRGGEAMEDGGGDRGGDDDPAAPRYALIATRPIAEGDEVTISYGVVADKTNEALLFSYGFVEDDPARDALTLTLPVRGREHMAALAQFGLLPRVLLRRPRCVSTRSDEGDGLDKLLSEAELAAACIVAATPERALALAAGESTLEAGDREAARELIQTTVGCALDGAEGGADGDNNAETMAALPPGAIEAAARYREGVAAVAREVLEALELSG